MHITTKNFASLFLLLLFSGAIATSSVGQVTSQNAEDMSGLMAEAIRATVQQAKQHAPADAITGPVFLHPEALERTFHSFTPEASSVADFTAALRSAYAQKAKSAEAEHYSLVVRDLREVSTESTSPGGEGIYSIADAGIVIMPGVAQLKGETAEIDIEAIFNDRSTQFNGHDGTGHILVRTSLVQENGQWVAKSSSVGYASEGRKPTGKNR